MAKIAAVLFDMDGTLLEWQNPNLTFQQLASAQFGLVHRTLVERGYAPPNVDSFAAGLYARAGSRWQEAMRTARSFTVYDLLAEGLPEMGLVVNEGDLHACVAAFESLLEPIGARSDAVATLTTLADRGLKLGLISNSWSTTAYRDEELRRAGLLDLLPVRIYSSTMKVIKPHPAIFERALAGLGVTAAQAVMVGDNPEMDVGGAQGAGMRGVWIDDRSKGLPDGAKVQPDAIIQRLGELIPVLDRWTES
jgi:HAD superfamily hydrolase (TIGR01549 family)